MHLIPRFYVPGDLISGEEVVLPEEHRKHIQDVLRLKPGAEILIFDGNGHEYKAKIKTLYPVMGCQLISLPLERPFNEVNLTLAQGIAKGEKMDLIIQKGTEIGINRFIPCLTEHTIVKLNKESANKKRNRWQKIIQSATEQSGRTTMPQVTEVKTFAQAMAALNQDDLNLIPWERERSRSIKDILRVAYNNQNITIFIGPEGGFSDGEIKMAQAKGVIPVTLGHAILRTETAGLVAAAIIKYELEM